MPFPRQIGDDTDRLRDLYTGAFTQPATDAILQYMRLFQHANLDGKILQRAGPITDTARLALIGETQGLVDPGLPHSYLLQDGIKITGYGCDGATGTGDTTLHAQDT